MAHRAHRPHNFRALSKPKHIHKHEHKHYWPYIPVLLLIVATFFVSVLEPTRRGVLAYATNTSMQGLLEATNSERQNNRQTSLQLNTTLSAAAQAKADDMVRRNYWSHNTPDGQEPWVFINNAGYSYLRAGENLAYGFTTSGDTVAGWMNSPSHRENLLDPSFQEVGFGFANSPDFNGTGPETVVVAMYGKPNVLANGTTQALPVASTEPTNHNAITSDNPISREPATLAVTKLEAMTKGKASWAVFAVGLGTGLALALLLIKHAAGLRHIIRDSERFILHHPLLDTVLVALVFVGTLLNQTTGFIK